MQAINDVGVGGRVDGVMQNLKNHKNLEMVDSIYRYIFEGLNFFVVDDTLNTYHYGAIVWW